MHYTAPVSGSQKSVARHDLRMLLCALLLVAFPAFAHAQTAGREELRGHIPEAIKRLNLQPLSRLSSSNRLHLAIGLPLRDADAAKAFIQQLYDPSSPRYHQYLTTEQFAEEFGPTADDYQTTIDFARAHGFTVTRTYQGRLLVDVDAAVPDVESAFQVRMFEYQHPTEHRRFYAPDVEPSVPSGIKILDISGLSSYPSPHPNSHVMKPSMQESSPNPNDGSVLNGQYIGKDFRAAYVPGSPLTGTGQSVALVQFDNYYPSDITNYVNLAGLSIVPLTNIFLDSYTGTIGDGNGEVSLDIEMVISMAPGVSKIYLYEGNPAQNFFIPNDVLQRIADDNNSKQISCSWGWNSGPTAATDNIFIEMASHGQSFFVASGDSDAYPGSSVDDTCQTCFGTPASSPYVTSVGGTTLSTAGPTNDWTAETVWNWGVEFSPSDNGVGSSGGYSAFYSIPSWQQGVNPANLGSTSGRNLPDVAMTGDHVYVAYGNGSSNWFGGTSCASPLWAGFTALVNQQGVFNGKPPVGFLNPAVYTIGTGTSYTACFHDVTTGNNEWSNSPSAYTALTGYDLCTGWGSPNGTNLINALVGAPAPVPSIVTAGSTLTTESCTPTNGVIDSGETVTVNFLLQNTGSADASNIVATLLTTNGVTALSAPQTYGLLTAGGTAVAGSFTFTATGQCGSNIIATLQIQNLATNLGNVTFPFSLGVSSATTNSFANAGNISIPTSGSSGKSTPYPSTITVSALSGLVSKVTVTLTNLSHTWPADIDVLLVGPGGQDILLMSAAGGDNGTTPISHVTITFDDAAASKLPQNTVITSGTYLPSDYLRGDVLASPAPARPYAPALSTFNGVNPNGTWSLYVFDDFAPADGGSIANGWKLKIITTTNSCCVGVTSSNHPPVISAASVSPPSPTTTNILSVTGISTNDLDNDPITLTYQWQQSTNNVAFSNIAFVANTLPAAATIAGDYYRVTITPNDGFTNGTPFTTASVLVPVDADGNGINDDWEVQYFGHIGINPNADADGTGQNNLFKYVAGLDPTNPASVFVLQIAAITNQSAQNNLLFNPLANGRTYTPQFNTDLVNGAWLPLPGYLGPLTNGNQATITDTNATGPNKFYRLDISLP